MIDTRIKLFRLLMLLMAVQLVGCATSATPAPCVPEEGPYAVTCYSSADVEGRIVDEASGKPIEGAVVIGIWQLESQGFEHYYGAAIHVVESVSDADGHYRLKGFEGIDISRFGGGELMDRDPKVSVYAEGYRPAGAGRDISEPGKGYHRISPLNGRDIKLQKAAMDDWNVARLWWSGMYSLVDNGGCELTRLPSLKALVTRIEQRYSNSNKSAQTTYMDARKKYIGTVKIYKNAIRKCAEGGRP